MTEPPAKILTGRKCLCRGCGEYFSSVSGFERHRRRGKCENPHDLGLVMRQDGFWSYPPDPRFSKAV